MQTGRGSGDFKSGLCCFSSRALPIWQVKKITLYTIWKLCPIGKDLDLREETICKEYANTLSKF